MTLPKLYANVCEELPPEYSDYENFEVKFGSQENYEIIKKIGRGKYSEVYEGINTANNERIVIKILKPGKRTPLALTCAQSRRPKSAEKSKSCRPCATASTSST